MELFAALVSITIIDLVLSGDNAVIIALASRNLPHDQRKKAVIWGTVGAVGLRVHCHTFTTDSLHAGNWRYLVTVYCYQTVGRGEKRDPM